MEGSEGRLYLAQSVIRTNHKLTTPQTHRHMLPQMSAPAADTDISCSLSLSHACSDAVYDTQVVLRYLIHTVVSLYWLWQHAASTRDDDQFVAVTFSASHTQTALAVLRWVVFRWFVHHTQRRLHLLLTCRTITISTTIVHLSPPTNTTATGRQK